MHEAFRYGVTIKQLFFQDMYENPNGSRGWFDSSPGFNTKAKTIKQHKPRLTVDEDVFRALRGKIRAYLRIHGKHKTLPMQFMAKVLGVLYFFLFGLRNDN